MISESIPVVILAGGNGTMLGAAVRRPKTMVEVCGRPLLDHIIKHFNRFGLRKFLVAAGHGLDLIETYVKREKAGNHWSGADLAVDLIDTGIAENTGARLARLKPLLSGESRFILTYGDVIADVPVDKLIKFHNDHGRMATLTAVHAPTRFRILGLHSVSDEVLGFADKPILQKDYISGGFYVLARGIFDLPVLTEDPGCSFEFDVLHDLVNRKQVMAYRHNGYWQSIDTERDMAKLTHYLCDRKES